MRSPVIERLMVRCSQVALKHVIHDIITRTLVVELRRFAIKRWVPFGDIDRRLKIPHSAKVECEFRILPRNAYNHQIQVKWNNAISKQSNIKNGVKQGGCLSSSLFSVYLNKLIEILRTSNVVCMYGSQYMSV